MKVKKYVGDTIQDTIFKVKADLGSDAIILNTRKYKKGGFFGFFGKKQVEVLAALEEERVNQGTVKEIENLKQMIKNLGRGENGNGFASNLSEDLTKLHQHLVKQGITDKYKRKLITKLEEKELDNFALTLEEARNEIIRYLGEPAPINTADKPRVVVFTGPTGVGKTTTIAKLAAKFSLTGDNRVGLITSDTYRIAAVQQLETYSEIVSIPLEVAYNVNELNELIEGKYSDYDLILIDTQGSSWNDTIQLGRLKGFAANDNVDEVHLLLSLNTKSEDLKNIINKFSVVNPDSLILTKLDETTTFGDIINLKDRFNLPYSYITFGQDVPDDLAVADPSKLASYILGDLDA